jgi:hypothetical protein
MMRKRTSRSGPSNRASLHPQLEVRVIRTAFATSFAVRARWRGTIESAERQLNVLEFCEYADALGADAADLLREGVKARG